jgi:hypothetical protein
MNLSELCKAQGINVETVQEPFWYNAYWIKEKPVGSILPTVLSKIKFKQFKTYNELFAGVTEDIPKYNEFWWAMIEMYRLSKEGDYFLGRLYFGQHPNELV